MIIIPSFRSARHLPLKAVLTLLFMVSTNSQLSAEPVILAGAQLPGLLGKPVSAIRICNSVGAAIPFQIDELTADGEYVCDGGKSPNSDSGNGKLDAIDEVVFLREDCSVCGGNDSAGVVPVKRGGHLLYPVLIEGGGECRVIYCTDDTTIGLSSLRYITYDHSQQLLTTPRYYAQFGSDRFHFTRAGILDERNGKWISLTKELRVEISLKALWGVLPIHYTENNLICFVKRYKTGPLRLIRRGDFHLRLGPAIRGSHAAVNQICYPYMVRVPVYVHLPVRFKSFFREAFIEMTPVIDRAGEPFIFSVPRCNVTMPVSGKTTVDTLVACMPDLTLCTLTYEQNGYGWLLATDVPDSLGKGSGFIFRRPSSRNGSAECGYRLMVQDVPQGRYDITNWVFFSSDSLQSIGRDFNGITEPVSLRTMTGTARNRIAETAIRKQGLRASRSVRDKKLDAPKEKDVR